LGVISPENYKNLNIERRRRGHWNEEPGRTALEQPTVVRAAIAVLAEQADWTAKDFSQRAGLALRATGRPLASLLPRQRHARDAAAKRQVALPGSPDGLPDELLVPL